MFRRCEDAVRPVASASTNRSNKEHVQTYTCDICPEGNWLSETDIEIHRNNIHKKELINRFKDKSKHYCSICLRPQQSDKELLRHIKSEHLLSSPDSRIVERQIFACNNCQRIFFNKKLLAMHIKYKHSPKYYKNRASIECAVCSKEVRIKTAYLWSHLLYHSFIGVSTCQICLLSCENRAELREHLQTHQKYLVCALCMYSTNNSYFFSDHIECHRANSNKTEVKTPSYKKYFMQNAGYPWRYEVTSNSLKGMFLPTDIKICILCREICTDKKRMKEHIQLDHAPEIFVKKDYICTCGEKFQFSVLLKQHIFVMGEGHKIKDD